MTRDHFRELNSYRPITITVTRSGSVVDLSSLSEGDVKITLRRIGDEDLLVDHDATTWYTDGSDGKVQWQATAAELDAASAGEYEIQLEIDWGTTWETVKITDTVEVVEHFGTHPS